MISPSSTRQQRRRSGKESGQRRHQSENPPHRQRPILTTQHEQGKKERDRDKEQCDAAKHPKDAHFPVVMSELHRGMLRFWAENHRTQPCTE